MFIYYASIVEGDTSKLGIEAKERAPYIKMSGIPKDASKQYDDFCAYAEFLDACIDDKIPEFLKEASQIPEKAERAKKDAESEFDSLSGFRKA